MPAAFKEQYINHPDTFDTEVAAVGEGLSHIPEQYRHRIAMAKWVCTNIHDAGGIAIFAHPTGSRISVVGSTTEATMLCASMAACGS